MDVRVARRYALALLQAAKAQQTVAEAEQDLVSISGILESRPDLREILESPKVPRDKKLDLVDKLFADRARPITLRLLRLLIEKGREREFSAVHQEFVRLREEADGVLRISITSAVPLKDAEQKGIVDLIAKQTNKRVLCEVEVDPSLMGGVRVQYGNSVLDGSVSGALKRLRERLYIDVLKQA
jgi:F-type H+-transporting ATPase subunit delta